MADARIRNLAGTISVSELQALLASLYMVMDEDSFTNAERIALTTFITSEIVGNADNNYQAMTPKAFYDSIMTTTRMGVARLATDGEINAKTGTGVLLAANQVLMQSQWIKDWFESADEPKIYGADNIAVPRAMSFDVNMNYPLGNTERRKISPDLPAGYRYQVVNFSYAGHSLIGPSVFTVHGFKNTVYTGSTIYVDLGNAFMFFRLSNDGREMSIYSAATTVEMMVSLHINASIGSV